jgi:photosystem II stability/assembly factor-like uncharacterized protein
LVRLSAVIVATAGATPAPAGTWVAQTSPSLENCRSVHFQPDEQTGFVVGSNGLCLKTTDGGTNWVAKDTGTTTARHRAVWFPLDATTGHLCSSDKDYRKTIDGGDNWSAQKIDTGNENLNDIHFLDADHGWIAGSGGAAYLTTDGGATWLPATDTGTAEDFDGVWFVDLNTGFMAGDVGTIVKTTDGGDNWTVYTPAPTAENFYGVHFPTATTGYVAGTNGVIFKTTDAGANWTAQVSGTVEDLQRVWFVTEDFGYVVGAAGTILRTSDGGQTWVPQNSGTTDSFLDVHFPVDETTGWVVAPDGVILKTTDSGGYQAVLHPTGAGSTNTFAIACGANHWQCVNDQPGDLGTGTPVANDGTSSILEDGAANREMFSLDDSVIPAGATVTSIEIQARVGKQGGGAARYARLLYDMGSGVVEGTQFEVSGGTQFTQLASETWTGSWTAADIDNLEIGIEHVSGTAIKATQIYVVVTYEQAAAVTSISSESNQAFGINDPTTAISMITVTEGDTPVINFIDDIRISIPVGFNMTWDTSDTTAVISGPDASNASTTVSYENGDRTLVIDVTSSFAANDWITVSGLSFTGFSAGSASTNLELDADNDGFADTTDDKTIQIGPSGNTYYVRVSGDDAANGLTKDTAWQTIDYAADNVAGGGWAYVGAGTYNEAVTPSISGTASDRIRFIADTSGAKTGDAGAVIVTDAGTNVLSVSSVDYVEFVGFRFTGGYDTVKWTSAVGGLLQDCEIDSGTNSALLAITSSSLTVTGCDIHDAGTDGFMVSTGAGAVVTDTKIHHSTVRWGFVADGGGTSVLKQCEIYSNGNDGLKLYAGDYTLANCLVYDNQSHGLEAGAVGSAISVWNCTIDDNVEDGISNIWETAVVRNCIITNNGINGIGVTGGAVDHTYNLVWGNGWNFSGTTVHGTEVEQDPLFISAADRHLQSGSPAIDVGTDGSSVTTLDFDGQARPIAAGWDIGYDEYGSPTATPRIVRWQEVEP